MVALHPLTSNLPPMTEQTIQNRLKERMSDQEIAALAERLKLNPTIAVPLLEVLLENALLISAKQDDYGPGNISAFGELGVLIRVSDKFERLKTLLRGRRRKPKNEAITDTWRDLIGYSTIAILIKRGEWPGLPQVEERSTPKLKEETK